jgi:hypothetical protein
MKLATVALAMIVIIAGCALAPAEQETSQEPLLLREGASWVRLDWTACGTLPRFLAGEAKIDGASYRLCWAALAEPAPHILLVFDDGDTWRVPPHVFRPRNLVPERDPPSAPAAPAAHRSS